MPTTLQSPIALPNAKSWWLATLTATFLWLCAGYILGNRCGDLNVIGPCKLALYASPSLAWFGVGWLVWALLVIPLLAIASLVQTWRRSMRALPEALAE